MKGKTCMLNYFRPKGKTLPAVLGPFYYKFELFL